MSSGVARSKTAAVPSPGFSDKGIDYIQGDITEIDAERRAVQLGERTVQGDFLLVALGAGYANPDAISLTGSAYNLLTLTGCRRSARRSRASSGARSSSASSASPTSARPRRTRRRSSSTTGCGRTTGAARSTSKSPRLSPRRCPSPARGQVARQLAERNIALHTEHKASAVDPETRTVSFANGEHLSFDVLLAVPRHVAPADIAESALAGRGGWIEPDRHTMRPFFDGVYAAGDCIRIALDRGEVPKAGLFAEAEATVAARESRRRSPAVPGATFDGKGYCFIEMGADRAAYVNGDFFAGPKPGVAISTADEKTFRRDKEAFERERLDRWFP